MVAYEGCGSGTQSYVYCTTFHQSKGGIGGRRDDRLGDLLTYLKVPMKNNEEIIQDWGTDLDNVGD